MNIIGDFGKFVIQYQNQIEFFLILLAVILVVVFIIRTVLGERRKRTLLSQINDTVSDIHAAVNRMDNRKPDVIYIDNRTADKSCEENPVSVLAEQSRQQAVAAAAVDGQTEETDGDPETESPAAADSAAGFSQKAAPDCGGDTSADGTLQEEKAVEIPRKYTDLECGISKNGKVYTIEELQRQIKE